MILSEMQEMVISLQKIIAMRMTRSFLTVLERGLPHLRPEQRIMLDIWEKIVSIFIKEKNSLNML